MGKGRLGCRALGFPEMAKIVKPGKVGCAVVVHYTVTRMDVLRELMSGGPAVEGTVAILRVHGNTMMSDTRHERITNYEALSEARGDVLLAGLGLGMLLHPILNKPEVQSVTVVEKERDVVTLISPTLPKSRKLQIVHADIFSWRPPASTKYDCIYFDIWSDASNGVATPDKKKLAALFRKYKAEGGWMGSWSPMTR